MTDVMPIYHLQIGELIASPSPAVISTLLGSCVSVCLYSEKSGVGGMIHYSLPTAPAHTPHEDLYRYGENAIRGLIEEVCLLTGEMPQQLCAKITGGAKDHAGQETQFPVGLENIEIARKILSEFKIWIVGESVGGSRGRKVLFHTATGRLQVADIPQSEFSGLQNQPRPQPGDLQLNRAIPKCEIDLRTVLCIGASTGGTDAIMSVMKMMPEKIPPTLIVQHIPSSFSKPFCERLNEICPFEVKEAEDGDELIASRVLVAPGGKQMKVQKSAAGYCVRITDDDPVNRHKPSVDYLFRSVAAVIGKKTVGVILTGMGDDGARGLLEMRKKGSRTIGQDEKSSVVYGMPRVALQMGGVQKVAPLHDIAREIIHALMVRKSA